MNFINEMKTELNSRKTLTENGAVAYATSGKELLDFLFATTAMRNEKETNIKNGFAKVYFEQPMVAVKFLFWLRDCRGGNGERRIFRICLNWLAENKPNVAKAVLELVPEFGRWDDLWCLLDTNLKDSVLEFVSSQWKKECSGENLSLFFKWIPSINSSSRETKRYGKIISGHLGLTPKQYRKTLSAMREKLDVVERKMTAKEWSEINYSTVPSQANIKYSNAFLRNDEDRRREYLASLVKGETKINAQTLQPHEIVRKYLDSNYSWRCSVSSYNETLEQLWKALPSVMIDNTLVVRDGSGSMLDGYSSSARPLDVATALAIYMADHNTGIWKDKFITFSKRPKLIDLSNCENLRDKLVETYTHDECENTNIEATMMLVLDTAVKNHCAQEEMPESIVIVSDMGFDIACVVYDNKTNYSYRHTDKTLFEKISDCFENEGYKMPKIIFWNLNGKFTNGVPMQKNELGVVLISGFSVNLLEMVMSGETDPYKVVLETINSERYEPIQKALEEMF